MTATRNVQDSIGSVKRRLWLLLLRGLGATVALIVLLMLAATFIFLNRQTQNNRFYTAPLSYLLQAYYQGRGDWQGVDGLFVEGQAGALPYLNAEWRAALLLDAQGRVLFQQGQSTGDQIGQVYPKKSGEEWLPITVEGQLAGTLVFPHHSLRLFGNVGFNLIGPVVMISVLLGLLTLLIGMLLMRRVVDPLARVIAAAGAVAGGDLSARVPLNRRHDDLSALSVSFNHMAEELENSDLQRRAMLADIAHELRTPLTILRGRLEGILDGVYSSDEAHIAPALEEVYLLERLVDDLRLLTLAEARQLTLELRPVDLDELASCVTATFEAEAAEIGIQLSAVRSNGGETHRVEADPQRMEQVVGNLIGNALRYTPSGGSVRVTSAAEEGYMTLSVTDDGPGVAEADLPYIFDRFWRAEKSRGRTGGGAGLGLAIAKQLIEAQGGRIAARNLAGKGFEVQISVPGMPTTRSNGG